MSKRIYAKLGSMLVCISSLPMAQAVPVGSNGKELPVDADGNYLKEGVSGYVPPAGFGVKFLPERKGFPFVIKLKAVSDGAAQPKFTYVPFETIEDAENSVLSPDDQEDNN